MRLWRRSTMTGTNKRTAAAARRRDQRRSAASRSKGRYSATRLPDLNMDIPATALAASLEPVPVIGSAQGAPRGAQMFS